MSNIISMNITYEMVGFLNMFDIVPDFVYPVFERNRKDNKYYFQSENEETLTIEHFIPIKELYIDKIIFFKNGINVSECRTRQVTLGSEPIFAFQYAEDHIQVGNHEELKEFFKNFKTEYKSIQKEISEFIKITG